MHYQAYHVHVKFPSRLCRDCVIILTRKHESRPGIPACLSSQNKLSSQSYSLTVTSSGARTVTSPGL
jgi:hypothetical protein